MPDAVAHPHAPRAAERAQVDAMAIVTDADGRETLFRLRDLSRHGLFLFTRVARSYNLRPGATLRLEIQHGDTPILVTVAIARIVEVGSAEADHYPTGFGCRIIDASADNRQRLDAWLAALGA